MSRPLGLLALVITSALAVGHARGDHVVLQNATASNTQPSFAIGNTIDGLYPLTHAGTSGWGGQLADTTTPSLTAVFETSTDLDFSQGGTLRFNIQAGWSSPHTIGNYRLSYTTDGRSTFADGLNVGGDVTANWIQINPYSLISSGDATLALQPNGSILASGLNPVMATDTIWAKIGPINGKITGFRLETLENPTLPNNGPGRSPTNGNFVMREFDVAHFQGNQVMLQNATALRSQSGFSVDNMIDGKFSFIDSSNPGWANNGTGVNVATFETVTDINPGGAPTELTIELLSGGFSLAHTLGKFRISATTADRSLFADGNDNGGAGVGAEGIWTVLDPISIVSDNPNTIFTEDATHAITASGTLESIELYTMKFLTNMDGITGFRIETLTDPSLPVGGPGRSPNGNFVIREFTVFAHITPEPASIAAWVLCGVVGLAIGYRRFRR